MKVQSHAMPVGMAEERRSTVHQAHETPFQRPGLFMNHTYYIDRTTASSYTCEASMQRLIPASNDSNTTSQMNNAVQDFLSSLGATGASGGAASSTRGTAFTTLPDLLASSTTIPMIDTAEESFIDNLLIKELPPALIALEMDPDSSEVEELDHETIEAVVMSLEPEKKREIVKKVLRSPQFAQSLMSLTGALRDGGVPNVSQALRIQVKNGGYTGPDRRVPLEGADAVEAFLEGTKESIKKS